MNSKDKVFFETSLNRQLFGVIIFHPWVLGGQDLLMFKSAFEVRVLDGVSCRRNV